MKRHVAVILVATPLIGCQMFNSEAPGARPGVMPAKVTCNGVAPAMCDVALGMVERLYEDEVVQSANVSPTGRAECLDGVVPIADVVVRLEGRAAPEFVTVGQEFVTIGQIVNRGYAICL